MTCPKSFAQPSEIQTTVLFYDEHQIYLSGARADISTKQKAWTTHLLDCTNELLVVRLSWNPETISNCHLVHRSYNESEIHYYFQVADYCNCFENGVGGKFRSFTMCGPPQISESLSFSLQHFFIISTSDFTFLDICAVIKTSNQLPISQHIFSFLNSWNTSL